MSIDVLLNSKPAGSKKPKNVLAGAIDIAIRAAEIHSTKLVVKTNNKVEHVSPKTMKRRISSAQA